MKEEYNHSASPTLHQYVMSVHRLLVTLGEAEETTTAVQMAAASLQQMISLRNNIKPDNAYESLSACCVMICCSQVSVPETRCEALFH